MALSSEVALLTSEMAVFTSELTVWQSEHVSSFTSDSGRGVMSIEVGAMTEAVGRFSELLKADVKGAGSHCCVLGGFDGSGTSGEDDPREFELDSLLLALPLSADLRATGTAVRREPRSKDALADFP